MREREGKRRQKKRGKKKKDERGFFPPFCPAVFLFHCGLVRFFPCSVRSGGSCVSGAHAKTGKRERLGKLARMIGEQGEQSAWRNWTCAPRLSLSLSLSPFSLTHSHTFFLSLSLTQMVCFSPSTPLHVSISHFPILTNSHDLVVSIRLGSASRQKHTNKRSACECACVFARTRVIVPSLCKLYSI